MPNILILGWARHGKDTAAEYLRDRHGVSFRSSSLFLAEHYIMPEMERRGHRYDTLEACYEDRVNHRALWREIIEDFNRKDPARLAKAVLAVSDCYVGMRTEREYRAARPLFDHVLWIDSSARGLPPEGRDSMNIEYEPGDMLIIGNDGTLDDLYCRLDVWAVINGIAR